MRSITIYLIIFAIIMLTPVHAQGTVLNSFEMDAFFSWGIECCDASAESKLGNGQSIEDIVFEMPEDGTVKLQVSTRVDGHIGCLHCPEAPQCNDPESQPEEIVSFLLVNTETQEEIIMGTSEDCNGNEQVCYECGPFLFEAAIPKGNYQLIARHAASPDTSGAQSVYIGPGKLSATYRVQYNWWENVAEECAWATTVSATARTPVITGITTDNFGNSYVIGTIGNCEGYSNTVCFGDDQSILNKRNASVVAKIDASGRFLWAREIPIGGSRVYIKAKIAYDKAGFLYIVHQGSSSYGNTLTFQKLTLAGETVWSRTVTSTFYRKNYPPFPNVSLAVDPEGFVIAAGTFKGTVSFGSSVVHSPELYFRHSLFVTKINPENGEFIWATSTSSPIDAPNENVSGNDLVIDAQGNIYVAGNCRGDATFGNGDITYTSVKNTDNGEPLSTYDAFVVVLNSAGNFTNLYTSTGTAHEYSEAIAIGPSGCIYITGNFQRNGYWNSWRDIGSYSGYARFGDNLLHPSGNPKTTSNQNGDSGSFEIFVAKLDPSINTFVWAKMMGGKFPLNDYAYDISVNKDEYSTITGTFRKEMTFGSFTLKGHPPVLYYGSLVYPDDAFVAQLDSNGTFNWALKAAGPANDRGSLVCHDHFSNILVSGSFERDLLLYGKPIEACNIYNSGHFIWKIPNPQNPLSCGGNQPPQANAGTDQTVHVETMVILDGSASIDPDENYPLSYLWEIISKPEGSNAAPIDPTAAITTFTPDLLGKYVLTLTVTDQLGAISDVATIEVTTLNGPPIPEAGPDKTFKILSIPIQLNGSASWDPDGDEIHYQWNITSTPPGSQASILGQNSANPSFTPDVYGEFIIQLIVSDAWNSSEPDFVTITLENIKPLANAGDNQATVVGDIVTLDGSQSSDENGDQLYFAWIIITKPEGSSAGINYPVASITSLIPDIAGEYIVAVIVNDGLLESDPDYVNIVAITVQDALMSSLKQAVEITNGLEIAVFKNANNRKALTNKLNSVMKSIQQEFYQEAFDKLKEDIMAKTDGYSNQGAPDKNDWILDVSSQQELEPILAEALARLESML